MAFQIRLFCLLPVLFAVATLREIEKSSAMLLSGGGVEDRPRGSTLAHPRRVAFDDQ
jgi:hypothetical protein